MVFVAFVVIYASLWVMFGLQHSLLINDLVHTMLAGALMSPCSRPQDKLCFGLTSVVAESPQPIHIRGDGWQPL